MSERDREREGGGVNEGYGGKGYNEIWKLGQVKRKNHTMKN